jgi:hypothetical protein
MRRLAPAFRAVLETKNVPKDARCVEAGRGLWIAATAHASPVSFAMVLIRQTPNIIDALTAMLESALGQITRRSEME